MSEAEQQPEPIWHATVDDGKFDVRVDPIEGRTHAGTFAVTVVETGETLINEEVDLAFGALFGPDASDVASWQVRSIDAIDEWIGQQEEGKS